MERAVAEQALEHLITADGALQDAFGALKDAGVARDLRKRIAHLISLLGTGLYAPIYREHPELCPEGLRFMIDRPPIPSDWPFGS